MDEHRHSAKGHVAKLPASTSSGVPPPLRGKRQGICRPENARPASGGSAQVLAALRDVQGARRCHRRRKCLFASRLAVRLLKVRRAPPKVMCHLCSAWNVQSLDAKDRDAAALAALGAGGPKLLQALNTAGRKHVEGSPRIHPNEPPIVYWLLNALSQIAGVHVWQLCINEMHVDDVITVSPRHTRWDCSPRVRCAHTG